MVKGVLLNSVHPHRDPEILNALPDLDLVYGPLSFRSGRRSSSVLGISTEAPRPSRFYPIPSSPRRLHPGPSPVVADLFLPRIYVLFMKHARSADLRPLHSPPLFLYEFPLTILTQCSASIGKSLTNRIIIYSIGSFLTLIGPLKFSR